MVKVLIVGSGGGELRKIPAKETVSWALLRFISYEFMSDLVFWHMRKTGSFGHITHRTASMSIAWGNTEEGFGKL